MSENKECAIIQDLLPLYVDGIVSEPSREYIEEHIRQCVDCKRQLHELGEPIGEKVKQRKELDAKQYKKGISYFKRKQSIKIMLIVIIVGISFYSGIHIKHNYQLDKLTNGTWTYNGEDVISFDEYNSVVFDGKFSELVNDKVSDGMQKFSWDGYGYYSVEWMIGGNVIRVNKENHSMEMMFRFKGDKLILEVGNEQKIILKRDK